MQKIIDFETNKEHYHADACIVWCFDDRFTPVLNAFALAKNYQHYDLVRIAGGIKALASPDKESDREYVLRQIEISLKLHHTPRVVLMNHSDCGAYGGLQAFKDDEAKEKEAHTKELQTAKGFLQKNLSQQAPIDLVFVDCAGIYEV